MEQELAEKLDQIGYPDFDVLPGEDEVLMIYIHDHLICGALYALSLPSEQLKKLIEETITGE